MNWLKGVKKQFQFAKHLWLLVAIAPKEIMQLNNRRAPQLQNAFTKTGTGLIELRRMEACEEVVGKLAATNKVTYLPKNLNMLFNASLS